MQNYIFVIASFYVLFKSAADGDTILCDDLVAICGEDPQQAQNPDEVCADDGGKAAFDNPTTCNCGQLCLKYLEEGDECKTSFTLGTSDSLCGYGLDCLLEHPTMYDSPKRCTRNPAKPCVQEQLTYERDQTAGILGPGKMKPNCDELGAYSPIQCTPGQTCYCSDKSGTRIFGEAVESLSQNMTCQCSLYWHRANSIGLTVGMRCLPDGSFDPLQCYGDVCYCYDEAAHKITVGPIGLFMMNQMKCYDPSIHRENYTNPCTEDLATHKSLATDESTIIIGDTSKPLCTPDGYYDPVQLEDSELYCSDYLGYKIEDFSAPSYRKDEITCNCARRRATMRAVGQTSILPECCKDGSFQPIQTRGIYSYCVDENGNQIGKEVVYDEIGTLECTLAPCRV